MGPFLIRRVLQSIPLLLLISLLVFLLIHAAPGGPLAIYLSNPNVRPSFASMKWITRTSSMIFTPSGVIHSFCVSTLA